MAFPQAGFQYVSGPLHIRSVIVNSAATISSGYPVEFDSNGTAVASLTTSGYIAGFAVSASSNSVPAGKLQIIIPNERTVFVSTCTAGATAANCASGQTGFHVKSGNSYFFVPSGVSSFGSNLYTIVPRPDGTTTIDSTDSSIFVVVNQSALIPWGQSGQPVK